LVEPNLIHHHSIYQENQISVLCIWKSVLLLYYASELKECIIFSYFAMTLMVSLSLSLSLYIDFHLSKSVFGSVVAGAFQITFRVKMHVNDVFLFFKNYFWHQHIKTIQNVQTILNFSKKKLNFLGTQPQPRSQTFPKYSWWMISLSFRY